MTTSTKPKVWLTGAGGQLGSALLHLFPTPELFSWCPTTHGELDLTDGEAVRSFLSKADPVAIVNCAAYTDVEGAETDRVRAYAVNSDVPRLLSSLHDRVVHIGTDYVYDGAKGTAYREGEGDEHPLSVYGASKLMGEQRAHQNGAVVLRTSWLYGPVKWGGGGFYGKIRKQVEQQRSLRVVTDEVSCPTSTLTLSRVIYKILTDSWTPGLYHVTDQGEASRYDFAKEIARQLGYDCEIERLTMADLDLKARRPHYSVLEVGALQQRYPDIFRPWEVALSEVIKVDNE